MKKWIEHIISNNIYVMKYKPMIRKNIHSLSYLFDQNISQSDCIKVGCALESVLRDMINDKCLSVVNLYDIHKKDNCQKDHIFLDTDNNKIIYAEIKSNLNLDSEKARATCEKCLLIENELKDTYEGCEVHMYLVCGRYIDDVPDCLRKNFGSIRNNVIGINQYLKMFDGIDVKFDVHMYRIFINKIISSMGITNI